MGNVQIFSPHIDDAALSLGGCILNWMDKGVCVKINNIFTISDWTHENPISKKTYAKDISQITELRKTEEKTLASFLSYQFEFWDFLDYPLRNQFSSQDQVNMEDQLLNKIEKTLNTRDSFFFPIGINHPDHLLIQRLCKRFLNKAYNIFFYEDLPYFSWGEFDYRHAFSVHQKKKSPVLVKIDFEKKVSLLKKAYASQISDAFLKSMRSYAYNKTDNEYYERYWKYLS